MSNRATRLFLLTRAQRYGIAVLGVMLVGVLGIAMGSFLGQDPPAFLFVVPIALACVTGGLGPGLVATGLSLLFVNLRDLTTGLSLAFIGVVFGIFFGRARKAIGGIIDDQQF